MLVQLHLLYFFSQQGCAGPVADLEGVHLTAEQRERCRGGLDERQLQMLKAQVCIPIKGLECGMHCQTKLPNWLFEKRM